MRMTKRLVQASAVVAGAIGVVAVKAPETPAGRAVNRLGARLGRDVRYVAASAPGIAYRLAGRRPDPDVPDDLLADRVRSMIGPLEKRLDVPRVHVMVEHRIALLHGSVPSVTDAAAIEHAVTRVSGIAGVESHLHVGLGLGDTRPSEGATVALPSPQLDALLDAASNAGASEPRSAVHAVLCGFADRIPEDERAQVFGQLPADVRELAGPPRRHGERAVRLKTLPQLVAAIAAEGGIEPSRAEGITRAVVTKLRALVPGEAQDVSSVLPTELRALWESPAAS
jgi:uncharacterized protein (DUF2267 family)